MNKPQAAGPGGGVFRSGWFWAASLFLAGLGARLWLIDRFGTALPFWDQWEEARVVYVPFLAGKLSLTDLFSAHNEHRILFTRLYGLALLLLNGQWDGRLQMVGNALIHSATLAGLGGLMFRWLERKYWVWVWLPLALVLALPFGWENSLAGFQSQFYFLVLFSLLTLWLLGLHPPGSAPWWCGAATALMALFTVASGFLAAAAVFALVLLRLGRQREGWKREAVTLLFCAGVSLAGLALKTDVRHHQALQAHSLGDFVAALGANLAWPWIVVPPFAVLNLLPLVALGGFYLGARRARHPAEEMTLALGLWTVLQGLATAYARGAEGKPPGWRYMDSSCFILVAGCFSIAILLSRYLAAARARRAGQVIFGLWGIGCAAGLVLLTKRAWQVDIPERQFYFRCQLLNTRAFLATRDLRILDHKPNPQLALYEGDPYAPRPAHAGEKLAAYLDYPGVRGFLPACVRDPLTLVPLHNHGFATNGAARARPRIPGEVSWGSDTEAGAAATGSFESAPIPASKRPFLEFRVAGDLGKPGLSLAVVELSSGQTRAVQPRPAPGNNWRTCQVRAPRGAFKVVARDASANGWFAFQAPREVGGLSWAAARLASLGGGLFFAGLGLGLLGIVGGGRFHSSADSSRRAAGDGPPSQAAV